ncbi:MAG TPA: hypothetical protein VH186_16620 [Chloroflexia bacterium]|nr:hypothetical protein [Chloroflexia bacterium]
MNDFIPQTTRLGSSTLDPTKHVNYTLGMVLGEDDFKQEFAYLSGRDKWLARDLLGYGTVCGLAVGKELANERLEIVVTPGVALTPQGQLVYVPKAQCAYLNEWLLLNKAKVSEKVTGSPPAALPLYVVLCYQECYTDNVPIPGEPCRTDQESFAASRIADDFKLEFRLDPPDQREEKGLRNFVAWLSHLEVSDSGVFPTIDQFLEAIRSASQTVTSPPDLSSPPEVGSPPEFPEGSPPAGIRLPAGQLSEYLRAAFRLWVTELRPRLEGQGCAIPPQEECLMLATLELTLAGDSLDQSWRVNDLGGIEIREEERPFLLHLRFLQEWLLNLSYFAFPGDTVVEEKSLNDSPAQAGISPHFSRADHTHGTPPEPDLQGDAQGKISANRVVALQGQAVTNDVPAEKQVLTFTGGNWKPADLPAPVLPDLGGDVEGKPSGNLITHLQKVPVKAENPQKGDVLTFNGEVWEPAPPAGVAGNFVSHNALDYRIVAAGIVGVDNVKPPVYNIAKVALLGNTSQVRFVLSPAAGYKRPDNQRTYIVKVLPVVKEGFQLTTITFFDFTDDGFILRVLDQGKPIQAGTFGQIQFMVEVSEYTVKAG